MPEPTGWASPAVLTSVWSAVASSIAAVIAWQVYRWQKRDVVPIVTCELTVARDHSDWLILSIWVKNATPTKWKLDQLTFRPKSAARGVSFWLGAASYIDNSDRFDPAVAGRNATSPVPLANSVEPAGTERHASGGGDTTRENVYLPRSSISSRTLSMRLTLLSTDAIQRKVVIAIRREVPAVTTGAGA